MTEQRGERSRRRAERLLGAPAAPSRPRPARQRPEAPRSLRWAAAVVAVEALGAAVGTVALAWLTLTGRPVSAAGAVAEVVFAAIAAVALAVCARGLWRVASWARGPVVALQILLGLLGYSAAFTAQAPQLGVPVLALVAIELYLLATPESRLVYSRRD